MTPPEDEGSGIRFPPKYIGILAMAIVFGGIIVAWLSAQAILPFNGPMVLGMAILAATVVVCCASTLMLGSVASKMPEYGDMEIRFEEGMVYFGNEEWENALLVFTELAGPKLNHKRALYYAARCYEQMDDWENVKKYCNAYLSLKPKDREVWEMLSDAHKRLFEYSEAEYAQEKASKLPESEKDD
ncbi:tetratricopeptide repeat protein [Candidatus Thorarchaeota archaeon]|nr:MAG: tetratricopeptide repeat protein [Candidatus Thorarchaeota archaeon]